MPFIFTITYTDISGGQRQRLELGVGSVGADSALRVIRIKHLATPAESLAPSPIAKVAAGTSDVGAPADAVFLPPRARPTDRRYCWRHDDVTLGGQD